MWMTFFTTRHSIHNLNCKLHGTWDLEHVRILFKAMFLLCVKWADILFSIYLRIWYFPRMLSGTVYTVVRFREKKRASSLWSVTRKVTFREKIRLKHLKLLSLSQKLGSGGRIQAAQPHFRYKFYRKGREYLKIKPEGWAV